MLLRMERANSGLEQITPADYLHSQQGLFVLIPRSTKTVLVSEILCTVDLLIPNFLAGALTVVWFSIMYRARPSDLSSMLALKHNTPT